MEFVACPTCMEKPGSPNLCLSCLTNRDSITVLKAKVLTYETEIKLLGEFCEEVLDYLGRRFLHRDLGLSEER